MKKNKIIGLLASVACVATAAGAGLFATSNVEASADFAGQNVSSFTMEYGAGVRIPTDDAVNGIRFTATLNKDVYAELEKLETETTKVNYGMLIVPRDWVDTYGALNAATVFGVGGNQVYTVETCENCTCGKKHISQVQADEMSVEALSEEDSTQVARLRGSIVNIQEGNETREFVGMAYIEYDQNGSKSYAFASYDDNNIDNNTRSMTYVTQLHLNDGGVDNDNALYNRYIQPYMEYEHKYTVEHYLPNEAGEYVDAPVIEEQWGTLNQTVNARNVAKFDNTKGEWATATMNNGDYLTSSPLYVNGNTVLKCYYQKVNNVLFDSKDENDVALLQEANSDALYSRSTEVTTVADPDGKRGNVVKISTIDKGEWGDAYLDMAFAQQKLQTAADGNWDYLKFSMYVTAEYEASGIYDSITEELIAKEKASIDSLVDAGQLHLYSNNILLTTFAEGEWVDVIIPKAKLNTVTYKADGTTVDWTSKITSVKKTGSLTKADFDETFQSLYGENGKSEYFFNIGTFSGTSLSALKGSSTTLPKTTALHDVRITYYIDNITWGVDYKAPEITIEQPRLVANEGGTLAYVPNYTVADDILPGKMVATNGSNYASPIKSSYTVYEKTTGETAPVTDGAYQLTQGKEYVLAVTANDWSVTDLDGNTAVKEVPLSISLANATSWTFDTETSSDHGLITANDWVSPGTAGAVSVYNKTYLDSYDGKTGVLKVETSMDASGANAGSELYFNFSEVEIDKIIAAFNANDNFALNMTIRVETTISNNYSAFGICLCGNGATQNQGNKLVMTADGLGTPVLVDGVWNSKETKMLVDTWYSISISKENLIKAFGWNAEDTTTIREQLNGTKKIFGLSDFTAKKGSTVTYYFDEISYSVA